MPKRRYERGEPTHDWQQIRPLLKDTPQINYEVIRPVVLRGQTPKERGAETGISARTIYYRANLFDQAGMASLLPAEPLPPVPKMDKRSLPPDIRQEIVDLHAQYPAFSPHEIATICFVKFNRKPAPATIKLILASGPKPSTTERRHPRYTEIEDGETRRRTVIRLHVDGWNAKSIAEYLDVSRTTVHGILRRFAKEQFAGPADKSHARKQPRKVDISTIQEIKKLSENPNCARCDFYVPKDSDRGLWLQTRDSLLKMLQEIPLGDEERAAVDGDVQALDRLLERLASVPTPSECHRQDLPVIPVTSIFPASRGVARSSGKEES